VKEQRCEKYIELDISVNGNNVNLKFFFVSFILIHRHKSVVKLGMALSLKILDLICDLPITDGGRVWFKFTSTDGTEYRFMILNRWK